MSDLDLRLAALSKLMENNSAPVEQRLSAEFGRVEATLADATDYDELLAALKTLRVISPRFHAAVVPLLAKFTREISSRTLTHGDEKLPSAWVRYRSASQLISEAIDATNLVRFVHIEALLDLLLELAASSDDDVRRKADEALNRLASYDLETFYGDRGLGAEPQQRIVAHLMLKEDAALLTHAASILSILRNVLSASIEGTSWSYNTLTINRGSITGNYGVAEASAGAIELLRRMYSMRDSVGYRKKVLSVMDEASRREGSTASDETKEMFERDALTVLRFLRDRAAVEELPVIQTIEHQAYWDYYHAATPAIEAAALEVRDAIAANTEYQIYKQLIGFEGVFGDWKRLRSSEESWTYDDASRRVAARGYVDEINKSNEGVWLARILKFAKTKSDDMATFPVFYDFLEMLGKDRPEVAIQLVRHHEGEMEPFLIPLLTGLHESDLRDESSRVIQHWLVEGRHLSAIAKSLYKDATGRSDVLSGVVLKGSALDDRWALISAMGVAATAFAHGSEEFKEVFMQALRELAKRKDPTWAKAVWFSRDFRTFLDSLSKDELSEILASLVSLQRLNYQVEEVLAAIAKHQPEGVLNYLISRLIVERVGDRADSAESDDDGFEAIPHQMNKLATVLSASPDTLIAAVRKDFEDDEGMLYSYRGGARLLQAVFPEFDSPLETALLRMVQDGGSMDLHFALAIVRAYGGSAPILRVCKAIVERVAEESPEWSEVAAAIETTGVVMGEHGLAIAYERKRDEIAAWQNDESPKVRAFVGWLTKGLTQMIEQERQRADQGLALRKYRYGANKDSS